MPFSQLHTVRPPIAVVGVQRNRGPHLASLRWLLLAFLLTGLGACGFALRGAPTFVFETVAVTPERSGGVAGELSRVLGSRVRPAITPEGATPPDVIIDVLGDSRQKVVMGMTAAGLVREFELRLTVNFSVRTPQGKVLLQPTTIYLQRTVSFNETAMLAKETEDIYLNRDMQTDAVQQIMRRLSAIKTLTP
jgi:LPS-assembly lipoprotein